MNQAPHGGPWVRSSYSDQFALNGANTLDEAIGEPKQIGRNMLKIADLAQKFRTNGNILPLSAISFPICLSLRVQFRWKTGAKSYSLAV
jgi:hypothetical protein